MESPLSPIVANIFMEEFEAKALSTALHPQACRKDLLMTPLLSYNQSIKKSSSHISIPFMKAYSSLPKTPKQMVLCPSWTL